MGPLARSVMVVTFAVSLLVTGCADDSGSQIDDPATAPSASSPTGTPDQATADPTASGDGSVPVLRMADAGTELAMSVGDTAIVFLSRTAYDWSDPVVDGAAVTISEDVSDEGSTSRSWTVTAIASGEALVSVAGSPPCRAATPPCASPDQLWSVRITVA